MENHANYSPWLHRMARLTAGATFLLIIIGGIVTSTDSGLAVPDWPTTFGYNMFLYPLSEMVGGILYEHSHRLMGSLVGILTIGLFLLILAKDSRKWLKWLGLAALIAVIVQGVLGGLRVTQINRNFAIVHACLAQAFFALLCGIAWFTSQDWWQDIKTTTGETARKLRRLSLMTTCLIYMQLIFGAILRHTGSRLDAHLLFAFLVALHIFFLTRRLLAVNSESDGIGQSMPLLLLGLLVVQLMLGTGAFFAKLTAFGETFAAALTVTITTAHVAVGALMLVSSFVLTLKIYRFTDASVTIETAASGTLVTE
ncbi:cytochrome oxidase assembly protein [Candidatus Poribacteria bacterium]|nr:cytochrome oxidase assembly protein [Candidatus Poribacteria bacterium]MYG07616.1 cytochrome oxidase assembly protein [Candidatus Poribacteria bacterium]MYK24638.1 cytochrome oxidase assembly protein [Candidatus Poribacteria bacterium]